MIIIYQLFILLSNVFFLVKEEIMSKVKAEKISKKFDVISGVEMDKLSIGDSNETTY